MKRAVLPIVVMILAPALARAQQPAAGAAKPAGPKPVIEVAEKVRDFGQVAKGDKITAVFAVKNAGDALLEITQVRPTCGCTVASYDKSVPPGGTGKIEAVVDTVEFTGPITKAVLVYSNDTATPQLSLVVKADVRAFVDVLPRALLRFAVLQGETATEKVVLVPSEDIQFKVTEVATGGGPYQVSFRELGEKERIPERKGSQWEVTVTVPPGAKEGLLTHKLTVKTTAPKAPEVPLTVSGVIRPIVQVIPAEINFGAVPGDAPVGRNLILVNNRQGAQLQLTDVKVEGGEFSTQVTPLQPGQRFQVAVNLPAGMNKGVHKATLRISTNDPSRKLIEVPIQAVVQ
ncbi:MAG: DUF1573 domain-containing protein [Acidobacteriota bacterium]